MRIHTFLSVNHAGPVAGHKRSARCPPTQSISRTGADSFRPAPVLPEHSQPPERDSGRMIDLDANRPSPRLVVKPLSTAQVAPEPVRRAVSNPRHRAE